MTISLIHPSRGRPQKSYNNLVEWVEKSGADGLEIVVCCDSSDEKIIEYKNLYAPINIHVAPNQSVVEATNYGARHSHGDILLYLSDDFQCFDNWAVAVINEFAKHRGPTLIKVDDCLQPNFTRVLTIPIMNRELYNKLGYFWHPEYKSMFVDEDLYWTAQKLGALKMATHLKFPHIHPGNPDPAMRCDNDETYKRSAANWEQGKAVFAKRKAAGFPE